MASATLRTALMTSVYAGNSTKNYETVTKHGIGTGGSGALIDYVYFSRPFPIGATISSARLIFYTDAQTTGTATHTITAARLKQSVSMTQVTYKTRPTSLYATTAAVSKVAPWAAGVEWSLDVTTQMQSVANGEAWYGWQLTSTSNPNRNIYGPRWPTSAQRPRLEVTWSMLPSAPASLSPGGGRLVGVTKPVLRATYTDVGSDNALASIQVQRNDTGNVWTSPTWDSGVIAATSPQLDTSTTTWPALAAGTTYWWRMRAQDTNGLWSPWSAAESFGYDAKSAVTITNPAASPNDFVTEDSPPITWTFPSGGVTQTQAAYQVTLLDPATGRVLWTSGKVTSAATDGFSLPPGLLTTVGGLYQVTVAIWDQKQRETTPGDAAYVTATRNFTYALSNLTTGTTGLTATPDAARPRVVLTWQRSTFPDSYTILRNNKVIASDVNPADVLSSGTTSTWTDPAPTPGIAMTYQVAAVVNGKASSGNATVTVSLSSAGMWLADKTRANEVQITGRNERDWTYGEQSEVLEVIGGTEIVLVTHAQRGLEGTVVGTLHAGQYGYTATAAQQKAAALAIKAKASQQCWLTAGDFTIPVVICNLTVRARPVATLSYDIAFEFYEVQATA